MGAFYAFLANCGTWGILALTACGALRCLAVPCGALRCLAVPCGALRRLAVACGALRCLAVSRGGLCRWLIFLRGVMLRG